MSSLLEISGMGLHPLIIVDVKSTRNIKNGCTYIVHPLIIVDVKSLLETKIGLDPLMSAKCGCQVYLQHR